MKTFVEPYMKILKEVTGAIHNAEAQGLPLTKIELTAEEWDLFVIARTTLNNGKRLPVEGSLLDGEEVFMSTKVYREDNG